ncbi:hypothetical protein AZE42_13231 [Rhizopogon vesiculosus]|uniref:Tc1-like transposase DDE domain-containing protein n=1 Tax=Rhizopogon vesiculosus TaxID=180088 RepID=A0A1J8PLL5_9AGAM|nr:hypothetical protein AZE42_13231 [Rhizopogon vesiculosus]
METVHDGRIFSYGAKALSLDGTLHLEVLDHSFTGEEFQDFVTGMLNQMQPWPMPNSVLVMDNASIHKVLGICDMVEQWCGTWSITKLVFTQRRSRANCFPTVAP